MLQTIMSSVFCFCVKLFSVTALCISLCFIFIFKYHTMKSIFSQVLYVIMTVYIYLYVMVCYVTLRYVMLRYVMLCYVMLCYVTLRYVTLCISCTLYHFFLNCD